jgi:SAM-dependent methyltransferase
MVEHAWPYVAMLQAFIRNNAIKSVVDVGCGDWQFSRTVDWSGVRYHGFDLFEPVIAANRERFGSDSIRFDVANAITFPPADLAICKDVLQHLPIADIAGLLRYFRQHYRFALVTNDIYPAVGTNEDIAPGGWRALRLDQPPFNEVAPVILQYKVHHGERRWIKDVCLIVGG